MIKKQVLANLIHKTRAMEEVSHPFRLVLALQFKLVFRGLIFHAGTLLYIIIGSVVGGVILMAAFGIFVVTVAMCIKSSRKRTRLQRAGAGIYILE